MTNLKKDAQDKVVALLAGGLTVKDVIAIAGRDPRRYEEWAASMAEQSGA